MQPSDRDEILDAVAWGIAGVGVRRTTMAEVARRAGRSRSTCYTHFPDVTAAAANLLTRELVGLLAQATADADAPHARAELVSRAVYVARRVPEHPVLGRILDLDAELLVPYLTARLGSSQRAILDVVTDTVARGQEDGSVREGDPKLIAFSVLLVAQSFVISARLAAEVHDRRAVLDELALVLDRSLAPVS
jgi:AcrR family transcriptional regulator